ncbi:probable iron binding protein from the HesB_IscA_SufA family [hydrothermal vent metagenome]|uniref:Probable iron binding protein from the HesB_IscA_SufA family n=1 Tax=hydrothermal vent metagenome TaxID=652676 RepID=A0A3B1B1Z6_9ZZZZ
MLSLTERAQQTLSNFINGSETTIEGLRIGVAGGGCSGMQYSMSLVESPKEEDVLIECGEVKIFIDPQSATLLEGVSVDFVDSAQGGGFIFDNPAVSACSSCSKSSSS